MWLVRCVRKVDGQVIAAMEWRRLLQSLAAWRKRGRKVTVLVRKWDT